MHAEMIPRRKILKFVAIFIGISELTVCYFLFTYRNNGDEIVYVNPVNNHAKVSLTVGVLSKLSSISRRKAIRSTWFQECYAQNIVVCKFFTDVINDTNSKENEIYVKERRMNNDLIYMPFKGGYNFAVRLLWMLNYFTNNFEFDFFLRVDDDYFVCLGHLLNEIPYRPKHGLYWGYIHCTQHVVRADEGFMILTRDIIKEALEKQNTTLMCSAYGDQAVALWIADSKLNITWFSDGDRIIHAATGYQSKNFLVPDICTKNLGLHGSYPKYMLKYGELVRRHKNNVSTISYVVPEIKKFTDVCKHSRKFDYMAFWPEFRFEPKLCKGNPSWNSRPFIGREELGREQIY